MKVDSFFHENSLNQHITQINRRDIMYNSQIVKERINNTIKKNKTSATKVLADCELSPNTINQMSDNKGLSSFNLAKIADYLGVSVDYLLGRTDEPKTETSDPTTQILVEHFNSLSSDDKIDVLNMVLEKSKKYKEK